MHSALACLWRRDCGGSLRRAVAIGYSPTPGLAVDRRMKMELACDYDADAEAVEPGSWWRRAKLAQVGGQIR